MAVCFSYIIPDSKYCQNKVCCSTQNCIIASQLFSLCFAVKLSFILLKIVFTFVFVCFSVPKIRGIQCCNLVPEIKSQFLRLKHPNCIPSIQRTKKHTDKYVITILSNIKFGFTAKLPNPRLNKTRFFHILLKSFCFLLHFSLSTNSTFPRKPNCLWNKVPEKEKRQPLCIGFFNTICIF